MSHLPGGRWLRFAERTFDRVTVETVIAPALADFQHEWSAAYKHGRSTFLISARWHWAVLKAIAVCLIGHIATDRHHAGRALAVRVVVVMALLVVVEFIPSARWTLAMAADHGVRLALLVKLLSLPSTVVLCIPIALFFASVFVRDRTSEGHGSSTPAAIAIVLMCTTIVFGLLMFAAPHANQAFRTVLSDAFFSRAGEPAPILRRGLAEMTLPMLNDHIAHAPSPREEARARGHRGQRFAFVALVPILGLVGLGLAGRWQSRLATLAVSVLVLALYYGWFELGSDRYGNRSFYGQWLANGLFLLFAIALLRWRPAATNATVPASE